MKLSLCKAGILIVMLNFMGGGNLHAQDTAGSISALTPSDVYTRVQVLLDVVSQVRFLMGKSTAHPVFFEVSNASPREVYYQAFTLLKKANRLSFEITRSRDILPKKPNEKLQPGHVFQLVQNAIDKLLLIRKHLGISENIETKPLDSSKTPSDVFNAIAVANKELNNLLRHQFAPEDVYQQVTQGISYSAILLAQFANAQRIPPEPDYIPGKQPRDVFFRLADCFHNLRGVAERSGYKVLVLKSLDPSNNIQQIEPSDVYDIASLLVSELAFLHGRLPNIREPVQAYHPGPKLPAHVFQRSGVLVSQIELLVEQAQANSNWIRTTRGSVL
ncbi:MAG: hypothetical protein V3U75_11455 [Methylococcaceae bacterium]